MRRVLVAVVMAASLLGATATAAPAAITRAKQYQIAQGQVAFIRSTNGASSYAGLNHHMAGKTMITNWRLYHVYHSGRRWARCDIEIDVNSTGGPITHGFGNCH